jgi:uncharacterized glyoxalase superfamily protein PhnB
VPALGAIGIVTRDAAKAAAFYRLLGVDVPEPDGDHLEATLPGGLRLMWDDAELIKQLDAGWRPAEGGPEISLAFECASPAEVDELHATIAAAGFSTKQEPYDAFWGQRYATVVDPDGNDVHLFAAL